MSETIKITVLREGLDAQAVRWGGDITISLSYTVPLWARETAVAHLARSLNAVEGEFATTHLGHGQAIEVAAAYARAAPRSRPRIRINPLRAAVTALAIPFVGALFAVNPQLVLTSSVELPADPAFVRSPVGTRDAVIDPASPRGSRPGRELTSPTGTPDGPRDPLTELLPRAPMPRIVRQVPARLPDIPMPPAMPPTTPPSAAPSYPAKRPSGDPGSIPWLPSTPTAPWEPRY